MSLEEDIIGYIEEFTYEDEEGNKPIVTCETTFDSLDFDELDVESIVCDIEVEFGVQFTDAEVEGFCTVGQLLAATQGKITANNS